LSSRQALVAGVGLASAGGTERSAHFSTSPFTGTYLARPGRTFDGVRTVALSEKAARLRGHRGPARGAFVVGDALNLSKGTSRRHAAVVLTADGRRVTLPLRDAGLVDVSVPGIGRFLLLGLDGLLGLITGSRRETDGLRRDERT